jgi:hypothetical protein
MALADRRLRADERRDLVLHEAVGRVLEVAQARVSLECRDPCNDLAEAREHADPPIAAAFSVWS